MSTMTLDKTSRPGKARPDELVPSRYALRLGEIDVLVVSDGVIQISAETMAPNADPAVLSAWLHDRFLPEWVEWSLNQVVVRSGGRTILIDSGLTTQEDRDAVRASEAGPTQATRAKRCA